MERHKTALILLLMIICGGGGLALLLGITLFQAALLATCQGLPPVWQQILFFDVLIMVSGMAVTRLSQAQYRV